MIIENNKNKKLNKKVVAQAFFEMFTMIVSIIAFAFIIGGMAAIAIPEVKAADTATSTSSMDWIPKGCCLEAKDGATCTNMATTDAKACKSDLVSTDCSLVENCQPGCCYDGESGSCSFNAPKEKCVNNGGNWTKDPKCEIPQCTLGCCILADQASITTSRQCTKLSSELDFQKDFQPLDKDGTCNTKIGLNEKGACVTDSGDFSGERNCKFTTKGSCKSGEFYENYLCTSKELNTICKPAKNTTCVADKDQIYYLDTCGNVANVYDAKKFGNADYWNKVITPEASCNTPGVDCGNCNYLAGSRCYNYRTGKDTKATIGNNVCRDLNCLNGRKHGESWCISDYSNTEDAGVAPVGSRWFRGVCMDGEITIEPCADFNQEVCVETKDEGFNEASCFGNSWRSCSAANSKSTYEEIKTECAKYDQCKMFLDIPNKGTVGTGTSGYEGLAGFKRDTANKYQGSSGDLGTTANSVMPWCVPKYTPGTVFWTSSDNQKVDTGLDYGGSKSETEAICALGNFVCVTKYAKSNAVDSWNLKDNGECYYYENGVKTVGWFEGLNERCKMLGPCGVKVNVAGEFGTNGANGSSVVSMTHIDSDGGQSTMNTAGYQLSDSYKTALKTKANIIKPGSLTSLTAAVIGIITGKATSNSSADYSTAVSGAVAKRYSAPMEWTSSGLSVIGIASVWTSIGGLSTYIGGFGVAAVYALAAAIAGYMIGQLCGKLFKLSGAETKALSYAFAAGGAAISLMSSASLWSGAASGFAYTTFLAPASFVSGGAAGAAAASSGQAVAATGWCWLCLVIVIIIIILTYIFTFKDFKYYVTSYQCKTWEPPLTGDCSVCNKDVRPCSEYRCRSLGQNCHYFNDEGEPGYCAATYDIWSAKIEPWKELISPGNKYTEIASKSFKIEGNTKEEVEAWENLDFGIKTDKLATCKLDTKHTKSIDEMKYNLVTDTGMGCVTGNCGSQGYYHSITLSPHVGVNVSDAQTAPLLEGDNNYYIRCKNYAGQVNDAEFAVKIVRGSGPDLTPPNILGFLPANKTYVKMGENSTSVVLLVNEPSECRYSQNGNSFYENMENNMSCVTNPAAGISGKWPCSALLSNLTTGQNQFYFACEDQPAAKNDPTARRNINHNSMEYDINLCSTGLEILDLQPRNTIISGKSPISATLTAQTRGCVENGKAICSYQFSDGAKIAFLNTDSLKHSQLFDNLAKGEHNINVICEDEAGNVANSSLKINVYIDDISPNVTRSYDANQKLVISTDEDAVCKYNINQTIGCDFDFEKDNNITTMSGNEKMHVTEWIDYRDYYIKCADGFGNVNSQCGIVVSTY